MSTKPQKKVDFHFVTGVPQSESERRSVRTIVRSNASNRRWRLERETAATSKKKVTKNGLDDTSLHAKIETSSNGGPSNTKPLLSARPERKQRLADRDMRRDGKACVNGRSMQLGSPVKVTNLAQNYFGSMPTSEISKQSVTRMLLGTAQSYSLLFPSGKGSMISQMAKDWFHQCLRTRGILHTALFCQAMRAQAARPGWAAMPGNELMMCQTEAVHAISDKLQQIETACDDESIRIVFSLTWHGAVKQDPPLRSPKQSPLADLQSLKMFMGIIACDPFHAQGLDNMLTVRGGLDKVNMPGLAFLVSYGDILTSSCNLTRPTWAYGSYAQFNPDACVDDEWLRSTRRTDHPLVSLGDGFSALRLWLPCGRASQMQLVFNSMAGYTRASEDFCHARPEDKNRALMADQRNAVQHSLMSLCLTEDDDFEERDLFELCWLAGVAYSHIAVFPIAPNAARFDRLARLIQTKLISPIVLQSWSHARELVLWTIVIGGLCAVGTKHRDWYVELLKQQSDNIGIWSWQALKLHLMDFLWFPVCNDIDGEQLWADTQDHGRILVWERQENGG